jgi:hypothetical protein
MARRRRVAEEHHKFNRRVVLAGAAVAALAPTPSFAQAAHNSAAVVRELASLIGREYHNERAGRGAERAILSSLRLRRYDGLDDEALAARITADAQTLLQDSHFAIMPSVMGANPGGGPSRPHQAPHRPTPDDLAFLAADNFGVREVDVLAGNIGRIQVRAQFYRPIDEVRARYAAAMTLLADTSALILDCTSTIGGDPKTVALFLSYFFDREPFVLNRFIWRNLPAEDFVTTRTPGGPLYGERRPLVVALSADSFSAAEELGYDVQVFGRGVVVGQKTSGAANHALPTIVADRFTAFIPQARAENPVTRTNWEGVGITPDVVAAEADTAAMAHRTALERVIASFSDDRRRRAEAALARLRPQ